MEVSWQVTGIRKDAYAETYRTPLEVDKSTDERNKYIDPSAFGLGEEYGIHYEEHERRNEGGREKDNYVSNGTFPSKRR